MLPGFSANSGIALQCIALKAGFRADDPSFYQIVTFYSQMTCDNNQFVCGTPLFTTYRPHRLPGLLSFCTWLVRAWGRNGAVEGTRVTLGCEG